MTDEVSAPVPTPVESEPPTPMEIEPVPAPEQEITAKQEEPKEEAELVQGTEVPTEPAEKPAELAPEAPQGDSSSEEVLESGTVPRPEGGDEVLTISEVAPAPENADNIEQDQGPGVSEYVGISAANGTIYEQDENGEQVIRDILPHQIDPQQQVAGLEQAALQQEFVATNQDMIPGNWGPMQPAESEELDEAATRQRHLRVQDALAYLDLVKLKFKSHHHVYTRFLEVMKEFKAQTIDTPGVIARVSRLFRGHKDLILGFNTFLPPGFRIQEGEAEALAQGVPATAFTGTGITPSAAAAAYTATAQGTGEGQEGDQTGLLMGVPPAVPPPAEVGQVGGVLMEAAGDSNQEFDHAITYVTKIKQRFHNNPDVYKRFLDVLHTYQKEQRTIKEVFEQVAELFQGHHDLLQEFTQFLPQPVAPQQQGQYPMMGRGRGRGARGREAARGKGRGRGRNTRGAKRKTRDDDYFGGDMRPGYSSSRNGAAWTDGVDDAQYPGTSKEMAFFEKVRQGLESSELYEEFLKCLNLFSLEILSKLEFVVLMQDLLGPVPGLFPAFKRFIGFEEEELKTMHEESHSGWSHPHATLQDLDWSSLKRYGPSYRILPHHYPVPKASGRTQLCDEVLNDEYVSVATGEEGGFAFVRHNQYAEALFRTEDDRYELDMVIEANVSTIRRLEPIAEQIKKLEGDELMMFRLDDENLLNIVHRRAIERIYGEHSKEILDGVSRNPVISIPIVLRRLLQKDDEWKKARMDWNKIWKEVNEKNYRRALDHQAFDFKNNDRKLTNPRHIIAEVKKVYDTNQAEYEKTLLTSRRKGEKMREQLAQRTKHHMSFSIPLENDDAYNDAIELLLYTSQAHGGVSNADREHIQSFIDGFLAQLMGKDENKESTRPVLDADATDMDKARAIEGDRPLSAYAPPSATPATTTTVTTIRRSMSDSKQQFVTVNALLNQESMLETDDAVNEEEVTSPNTAEDEQPVIGPALDTEEASNIAHVSGSMMVLFRVFSILVQRLVLAQQMSTDAPPPRPRRDPTTLPPTDPASGEILPYPDDVKEDEKHRTPYQKFIAHVKELISQQIDNVTFEDSVRELMGQKSFVVFTIDRVLIAAVRQLQAVFQDGVADKLCELLTYERGRGEVHARGGIVSERDYLANALALADNEQLYRIELGLNSGVMTVEMLNGGPPAPPIRNVDQRWADYVQSFIHSEPSDFSQKKVLNRRTNRVWELSEDDRQTLLTDHLLRNRQECVISPHTYKMRFVHNTSDFMYRGTSARMRRRELLKKLPSKAMSDDS